MVYIYAFLVPALLWTASSWLGATTKPALLKTLALYG
jgi:hypothetical protein